MLDIKSIPSTGGICVTCTERSACPMVIMLPLHRLNVKEFEEYYADVRPDLWDEESIDEPEYTLTGNIVWCPLYSKGVEQDEI